MAILIVKGDHILELNAIEKAVSGIRINERTNTSKANGIINTFEFLTENKYVKISFKAKKFKTK